MWTDYRDPPCGERSAVFFTRPGWPAGDSHHKPVAACMRTH